MPLGCPPQQVAAGVHVANRFKHSANFAIQSPRSAVSACCGGGRGEEGHVVKRVGSFHTPIKSTKTASGQEGAENEALLCLLSAVHMQDEDLCLHCRELFCGAIKFVSFWL